MSSRARTVLSWFGAGGALLLAGVAVASPRVRYDLASSGAQVMEIVTRSIKSLQMSMRSHHGRQRAALEEMIGTTDPATTQWESSLIVSKVASALAQEPRLRGQKVSVRIIGGILHLEGEVRIPEDKSLAGEIARHASGAELVANDLKVVSTVG